MHYSVNYCNTWSVSCVLYCLQLVSHVLVLYYSVIDHTALIYLVCYIVIEIILLVS